MLFHKLQNSRTNGDELIKIADSDPLINRLIRFRILVASPNHHPPLEEDGNNFRLKRYFFNIEIGVKISKVVDGKKIKLFKKYNPDQFVSFVNKKQKSGCV